MSDDISTFIARINEMDLDQVRAEWSKRFGPPPQLRSRPMMRMQLAWRVQVDVYGDLDTATRKALRRKGAADPEGKELGIGARLTRGWKGKQIEVVVEEGGFRWEGALYPSLSAAARAITGIRWNGPRFFGLRQ